MQIGDKISAMVETGQRAKTTKTGTVVYIHPKHRFYVLRFDYLFGSFCESFEWGNRG